MQDLPYWRLAGAYFFYFAYLGAFAPYFSLYLSGLGVAAAGIGMIMSLPQMVRIVAPHLWGWLADRDGRMLRVARIGSVSGTLIFCALFFVSGFEAVFAVVLLMSFCLSAALPLLESTTLAHLGSHHGRYGRVRIWGSLGFIAAVTLIGYALDAFAVGVLLWIMLAVLLLALAFLLVVPEAPRVEHTGETVSISRILRRPPVIALFVACALMSVAHGPYYTFYSIFLVDHGYAKSAIGWLWTLGVVCEIGIFFWLAHLLRAFSLRAVLIASFALAGIRFVVIGWCADSLAMLLLAQTLHAASFGSFHASALGYVNRYFSGRHQARGQAIYTSFAYGVGGTLGGIYAGSAWEHLGPRFTFTGAAVCAFAGMLILWRHLRETGGKAPV
jgi:PPP family 3-phenylpropionic acid transporter